MAKESSREIEIQHEHGRPHPESRALRAIHDFEDVVENFFGSRLGRLFADWPMLPRQPIVNIEDRDREYLLTAELPGIPQDDIQVTVEGNRLSIYAEKNAGESSEEGTRRQYQRFQQNLTLPSNVEADRIEANCENGILEILLPKVKGSPSRRVEIGSKRASEKLEKAEKKDKRLEH